MKTIPALLMVPVIAMAFADASGHGLGSETFPPVELDGRQVTLEVSSESYSEEGIQDITISFLDFDSKITIRDVTFLIKAERGDHLLFEREFEADDGFLVFSFVSEEGGAVTLEEGESSLFGGLLGLDDAKIIVKGPRLGDGGLYKFDVTILAADGHGSLVADPLMYSPKISIAQESEHPLDDPNFGSQTLRVISYYDEISDFEYDPSSKEIRYAMPFEWTEDNVLRTSVVHEEVAIPKTFGDLLVSGFTMHVNGIRMSDDIATVDDFFEEERVVHFIIYQKELVRLLESKPDRNGMNFVITPDRDYPHMSSVTGNGQFRILMSWEPEHLRSDSTAKIMFDITDVFLRNKPVPVSYEFSVTQGDRTIHEQAGISTESREEHNMAEFVIPGDVTGIVNVNFRNLDGNEYAATTIPVAIDPATADAIPGWIKTSAKYWVDGQIDDEAFIRGIEYLVRNDIIRIPHSTQGEPASQSIPGWIKTSAKYWVDGQIDDGEFARGLGYLIQQGIIRV